MKYLVFHSRTGAAAVVAALQYLNPEAEGGDLLQRLRTLPDRGKFFVRNEQTDLTVLAVASGRERFVLQHALRALTKQFKPGADIELRDLTKAEWRRCWLWVGLLRKRLLPEPLAKWFVAFLEGRVNKSLRGARF